MASNSIRSVNDDLLVDTDLRTGKPLEPVQSKRLRLREPLPARLGELRVVNTDVPQETSKGKSIATCIVITVLILAVIGGLVAMGLTGQFTSDGWICKVAFPAIKEGFEKFGRWVVDTAIPAIEKFMHMKANLTVGQGFLYIGLPVVSAALIAGLSYKYGPDAVECLKAKRAERQAYQEQTAQIKEDLKAEAEACEQERTVREREQAERAKAIDASQAERKATITAAGRAKRGGRPPAPSLSRFGGDLPPHIRPKKKEEEKTV